MVSMLAALVACSGDVEAPPELVVSAQDLDFGTVSVGASELSTFTLANKGGGEVTLLSIQLTDGEPAVWDLSRDDVTMLGPGDSLEVGVTFAPNDQGTLRGRIQVRSDDADQATALVDLVGVGGASIVDADGDGYSEADGDCDDDRADVYPGGEEICDGRDNDCDGEVAAEETDGDGDGFRLCDDDCDDADGDVYPGADEICDEKDSDCDGVSADREDLDGDGYTICDDDCDDSEPLAYPGNFEVCDEVDNDCSGEVDDIDEDADGHSICHGAGDCDDSDFEAHPVIVDPSWSGSESGTEAEPYNTLEEGLANLDGTCNAVWLAAGEYELGEVLIGEELTLGGDSAETVTVTAPEGERHFDLSDGSSLRLYSLSLSGASVSGDGGSVRVVGSELVAEDVHWTGNTSTGDGGAVAVASGSLELDGCLFDANIAEDDGGAVALVSAGIIAADTVFSANQAVRGGGLLAEASAVDVQGCTFTENSATDIGGGVNLVGGSGLAILRSEFHLNTGAGLAFVDVVVDGTVANNLVQDNDGPGVRVTGSVGAFALVNNTVVANGGVGIEVDASDGSGLEVLANLACFNDDYGFSGTPGGGWNSAYGNAATSEFADDFGAQNDEANPLFADFADNRDPSDDDLSLSSGSPAIDNGPPDSAYDDGDGSRNDRGYTGGPEAE